MLAVQSRHHRAAQKLDLAPEYILVVGVSAADLSLWVDKALERSRQATIGAIGGAAPKADKPWWQAALAVAGAAGLAGLVAFAVSAALDKPIDVKPKKR